MNRNRIVGLALAVMAGSALAGSDWPQNAAGTGSAPACKRKNGGAGLVPCCEDVASNYMGECGIERPPAPTVPKVPVQPGGETAGLRS